MAVDQDLSTRIARNVKQLRDARGMTQQQMSRAAGVPRATWANLESGGSNPTLTVLHRVALALQVSIEELLSTPRAACQLYPRGALPERTRDGVQIRKLLPDQVPAMEIERLELPPGRRLTGIPHTPGTREYLFCEAGSIVLSAAGEEWRLEDGDVIAFRGDQRHSYLNPGRGRAIGFSVVILTPLTPPPRK